MSPAPVSGFQDTLPLAPEDAAAPKVHVEAAHMHVHPLLVANAFVAMAQEGYLNKLSNTKLQSLLYLTQAQYRAHTGRWLMNCVFERWLHGPVAPEVWEAFKTQGSGPLRHQVFVPDPQRPQRPLQLAPDRWLGQIMQDLTLHCENLHAVQLGRLLRQPDAAWGKEMLNTVIGEEDLMGDAHIFAVVDFPSTSAWADSALPTEIVTSMNLCWTQEDKAQAAALKPAVTQAHPHWKARLNQPATSLALTPSGNPVATAIAMPSRVILEFGAHTISSSLRAN